MGKRQKNTKPQVTTKNTKFQAAKVKKNNNEIKQAAIESESEVVAQDDSKKEKGKLDKASKITGIIVAALGVSATVFAAFRTIYNLFFKMKCERFYNIPERYFNIENSNIFGEIALFALILLAIILMFLAPRIMKKGNGLGITDRFIIIVATFLTGLLYGCINYIIVSVCAGQTLVKLPLSINIIIIAVTVIAGMAALDVFVFVEEVRKIKREIIKNIIAFLWALSAVVSVLVTIFGSIYIFKENTDVANRTKYESVIIDNDKYILISELKDNKILVGPCETDENENYKLLTYKYQLVEIENLEISYIDMPSPPQIIKNADITDDLNNENAEN